MDHVLGVVAVDSPFNRIVLNEIVDVCKRADEFVIIIAVAAVMVTDENGPFGRLGFQIFGIDGWKMA